MTGLLRKRKKDTHKGDYGHVFVLAGSRGMTGAAALCANAVLRAGAGIATLGVPDSLSLMMARKLTEVMTLALPETSEATLAARGKQKILKKADESDVVVIGPGLSRNKDTVELVRQLVLAIKKPMVIDADGLNAIAGRVSILKKIKCDYILTPHPGEMARLVKKTTNYVKNNRLMIAKKITNYYNAVVVLKGHRTIIAGKRKAYVNKTGNPGMATAGSGDVLTGLIGGFLAQGLTAFEAARLGVYVHGLAGDLAAKEKGEASLIAGDILEKIPQAIVSLAR